METHLKGIGVENFRVFKDEQYFDFAPITVLTGTNSSGKSSLINLLNLLNETFKGINSELIENEDFNFDYLFNAKLPDEFISKTFGNNKYMVNHASEDGSSYFTHVCNTTDIYSFNNEPWLTEAIIKIKYELGNENLKSIAISINSFKDSPLIANLAKLLWEYNKLKVQDLCDMELVKIQVIEDITRSGVKTTCKIKLDILYILYNNYLQYGNELNKQIELFEALINKNHNPETLAEIQSYFHQKNIEYVIDRVDDREQILYAISAKGLGGFRRNTIRLKPTFYTGYSENLSERDSELIKNKIILEFSEPGVFYSEKVDELSFLTAWCGVDNKKVKELEQKLIAYYETENLALIHFNFTLDTFKLLSSLEWKSDGGFVMQSKENFDFWSIHKSGNSFGLSFHHFISEILNYFQSTESSNEEGLHILIQNLTSNNSTDTLFLKELFIPFLSTFFEFNLTGNRKLNGKIDISKFEKDFYSRLLKIFKEILVPFFHIKKTTSVITNSRVNENRFFPLKSKKELYILKRINTDKSWHETIKKILIDFDIAQNILIEIDEELMIYKIILLINNRKVNLKDLGFGIVKLIPIMLALNPELDMDNIDFLDDGFIKAKDLPTIIIIEEPESNLHPALQSKLADLFVDLSKRFNIQFIIETHSEYLIRKLQYLTAKNEIKTSDTQIYYFHHPDRIPKGEKNQIYPINIRDDGSLTKNFGTGFFDEAGNISLELFLLKKENQN